MIRAGRVATHIDIIALLKDGKIAISSAQIFGLNANLYKLSATSSANYQFVLDSLTSKDDKSTIPLDLNIQSLVIRNGLIRYNQEDIPLTRQHFNFKHLELSKISTHLIINRLTDHIIDAEVRHLSFSEASGFKLKDLSFHTIINENQAEIYGLKAALPNSHITIDRFSAIQQGLFRQPISLRKIQIRLVSFTSKITPTDIAAFFPESKRLSDPFVITLRATLSAGTAHIRNLDITSGKKDFTLSGNALVSNISTFPTWNLQFHKLNVTNKYIRLISKKLHKTIPAELNRLGNISFQGTSKYGNKNFQLKGLLATSAGKASLNVSTKANLIMLEAHSKLFNLGRILGDDRFHYLSMDARIVGKKDLTFLSAKGTISRFDFQGYSYRNLYVNGRYANNNFDGKLSINDTNGSLELEGQLSGIRALIQKQQPLTAHCILRAHKLNLSAMHLSNELGQKNLSFNAVINGTGSSLNNLTGKININNFTLSEGASNFQMNHLDITTHNGLLCKSLKLNSDIASVNLNGNYQYESLPKDFICVLQHYIPALVPLRVGSSVNNNNSSYSFDAKINNIDLLKQQFGIDIQLLSPIKLAGNINTRNCHIELGVSIPDAIMNEFHIRNTRADIHSKDGTLFTHLITEKYGQENRQLAVELFGSANSDKISATTDINVLGDKKLYGEFNCDAQLFRSAGQLGVGLRFHPSEVVIDTIRLNVQPSDLTYSSRHLNINHFELSNRNQHIIINGKTTGSSTDSLLVQLKDIDVPYVLDLVNFHNVKFDGSASGSLAIKSIFNNLTVDGQLEIKDFKFNTGEMGNLLANVTYNNEEGKLHIDAKAKAAPDSYTDIKGYVDIKNSYINLPIYAHGTHLYFLKEFCGSFMDNIRATAQGWCKVVGPLSDINIEGDMYASGKLNITPIGTFYDLKNCRIRIIPNEIVFEKDTVLDKDGHIGIVTGGLHHQSLRHLTYDINIEAQNLLAYDFPKKKEKNNTFWGVIYGTGMCRIHGRSGEVTMNVDATPNHKSFITYDASTTSPIDESSFIKWHDSTPNSVNKQSANRPIKEEDNTVASQPSDLHINFLINTTPDFTLGVLMDETTGDNILLNGTGGIKASYYNKGGFQMFGNYNVGSGAYNLTIQNIIKKQFSFLPGSVLSFGGDPFEAALNLKGVYRIKSVPLSDLGFGRSFASSNTRVDCLMNIGGSVATPSVNFGLELPNLSSDAQQMIHSLLNSEQDLNQQVLYLLAFGRFYPQSNNNAVQEGTAAQSQTSLAMQSLLSGTLSQQINTVLSNIVKNNNWSFGANIATGNEGFENAEYEGTLSGSFLNNRLLINGEFGYRDNVTTNNSSFIGDFDIRYLLFPSGNMALRFYNHNTDRYFTRNSLTTQGIGLIIKKDFTTVWELLGLKSKSKKNKL